MEAFIDDANAKSWSDLKAPPIRKRMITTLLMLTSGKLFSTFVLLDDLTVADQTATAPAQMMSPLLSTSPQTQVMII